MNAKNVCNKICTPQNDQMADLYDRIHKFCLKLEDKTLLFRTTEQAEQYVELAVAVEYANLRLEVGKHSRPVPSPVGTGVNSDGDLVGRVNYCQLLTLGRQLKGIVHDVQSTSMLPSVAPKSENLYTLYIAESEADLSHPRETAEVVITKSGKVIKDRWGILLGVRSLHPEDSTRSIGGDNLPTLARFLDMDGGCIRPGTGGDCANYLGLPGKSIPDQHDGPDDTVDIYGKPNGWCWSCWKSHQIEEFRLEVQELRAWQEVAVESNRDIRTYLQVRFPSLEIDEGTPVGNVRKAFDCMDKMHRPVARSDNPVRGPTWAEQALDKLSGDLSHDNIAAAKQILKDGIAPMAQQLSMQQKEAVIAQALRTDEGRKALAESMVEPIRCGGLEYD